MASLLTNASAQTALRQLRAVSKAGENVRAEISTGLKVRSPKQNAAFFIVSAKSKGDAAIMRGLRDNLTLARGAIDAAQVAGTQLNNIVTQLSDMVAAAQPGVAMKELNVTYDALIDQAREIIEAAEFQGVNLLASNETRTTVTDLDRSGNGFKLHTLSLQGGDFLKKAYNNAIIESGTEFVIQAENYTGKEDVGVDAWVPSTTEPGYLIWEDLPGPNKIYMTPADVTANSPRLDYRVQITNPGTYYVNVRGIGQGGAADSIHIGFEGNVLSGTGGVRIPNAGGNARWGGFDTLSGARVAVNIPTTGIYTINIWGREDGTLLDGIVFRQDPTVFGGSDPLPPSTSIAGNADLPFFSDLANGAERRETAGFVELLEAVTPESSRFAPEAAMTILDAARSKLNRFMSKLGSYETSVERKQDFLTDLSSNLDLSVSALIEADLAEASSRLQAIQVQGQLATQSLTIANQRPTSILSLFR
jgi:flagellin